MVFERLNFTCRNGEIESDELCFLGDSCVELSSSGGGGRERMESEDDGKDRDSDVDE